MKKEKTPTPSLEEVEAELKRLGEIKEQLKTVRRREMNGPYVGNCYKRGRNRYMRITRMDRYGFLEGHQISLSSRSLCVEKDVHVAYWADDDEVSGFGRKIPRKQWEEEVRDRFDRLAIQVRL